ncbi:MAG: phospholipase C [Janthinobacterium lividum]
MTRLAGFATSLALATFCIATSSAESPMVVTPPQGTSFVQIAPKSSKLVQQATRKIDPPRALSHDAKLALLRDKVKYVFVLFQENRSFDFYFGTYPGADGLYSKPAAQTPGFVQPIVNVDGTVGTISPFRIPATVLDKNGRTVPLYPQDTASVNHSHITSVQKLNLDAHDVAANDRYAVAEEGIVLNDGKPNRTPTLARKQMGELVMAHVDCDTIPFLWQYADRFTLFDHFMDTVIGPSGPNALAMIAGQSGATQWMLHPEQAETATGSTMPMTNNPHPMWDKSFSMDEADKAHGRSKYPEDNLTFATLPLSFMGDAIKSTTGTDKDGLHDLMDVQDDIEKIAGHGVGAVNWGWYQQGYGHEPNDPGAKALHVGYVAHHNAPQYFGYIANNPAVASHMHGLQSFFDDVTNRRLPPSGVFYVRGGYGNIRGLHPADPNPRLAGIYNGNDDHPGYFNTGVSEAMLAESINAIAASPYWKQSVILIAYDESDGLYDHVQPHVRSHDSKNFAMNQGPRIPFVMISPYAVAHGISHEPAEHSSIIKMIDELNGLIPLADLPDEEKARQIGLQKLREKDLGPADDKVEGVGDLLSGFDDLRLSGKRKPLDASYVTIAPAELTQFPHRGGHGCQSLGITPTDTHRSNPIPADFNPRPDTTPGIPTSGTWIP